MISGARGNRGMQAALGFLPSGSCSDPADKKERSAIRSKQLPPYAFPRGQNAYFQYRYTLHSNTIRTNSKNVLSYAALKDLFHYGFTQMRHAKLWGALAAVEKLLLQLVRIYLVKV